MPSRPTDPISEPRPARLVGGLAISAVAHVLLVLAVVFDVAGLGGGFGLGVGPGVGIGAGGGIGLGEVKRRQIFSLEDIPEPVRPQDPATDEEAIKRLLEPTVPQAITIPRSPRPTPRSSSPVVKFARPAKPVGSGTDLGARLSSSGAGTGGLGLGGGGGGLGVSLGAAFSKYVGSLRKVGLDVAIVVDSTGSMQNVIDELKRRLRELVTTMQRLVPTARIGAVAFRDKADDKIATAPRQSEDFVVKWSDLTFNAKKVQTFLGGIVAEGGGDWEEAVKEGVDTAMNRLKWRSDAKKVIIIVGSSPPHKDDLPALRTLVAEFRGRNGVVSTIDVSELLHAEHERRVHKWLYGEELQQVSPLPEFYQELRSAFRDIARQGGGEDIVLSSDGALTRHLLVQAFGPQWQKEVGKVARGL